ncbi:inhibitor of KinA [Natronobacillus azotifigens]|uniref:5-oxoprolinase subunit PxpB n=1 Tax=Natronobacillus azotifigens TaxID=472978 RepID=A0A9J6R9E7_9BACI|nr:5-oxoprolinase subunit PxpB [Natronobacillus azotifigens]MCZ0702175.1 5-oxoprolinase subunit PxpB [Natronobacillus azotifigens]
MEYKLSPMGDQSILIELGNTIDLATHDIVQHVVTCLDSMDHAWIIEYIPAFTSITVIYDPVQVLEIEANPFKSPYHIVANIIEEQIQQIAVLETKKQRTIEIPVLYGGEYGPDISIVAEHNHLTIEEVISFHTAGEYTVYMIGFAPGFPYIGGLPKRIATPRKTTPRSVTPARSVGIAGEQTGVYSIESPGGWQVIGRTPLELFQPNDPEPTLLQTGDKIKFKSVTKEVYDHLEAKLC